MDLHMLNAVARVAQGPDPAAARASIAALLARHPDHPDLLTLLGIVEQRTGNAAAAVEAFGRARSGDPANPARLGNHAIALKQVGRFTEAIDALRQALVLRPGAPVTLANLGSCLIAADRYEEAETALRAAIAAQPNHAEAWNNLGVALARTDRVGAACEAYRAALAARPDYTEARLNLVDALDAAGAMPAAQTLARTILHADPAQVRAANQLAGFLAREGALDEAAAVYRDALDRNGLNHSIGVNLAMTLLRRGEAREALALADRLIAALPTVTTPLALKCAALERLNDHAALEDILNREAFVRIVDLAAAPGFATMPAFNAALETELRNHASLQFEPEGLVTRNGRQSDDLAHSASPALSALTILATEQARAYLDGLPAGDHPFLRARPQSWSISLWGTILAPGGAVEAHIHAPNWLSGVYYPHAAPADDTEQAGWFAIGALPEILGGGGTMHNLAPRAGRMILFPSYFWHKTLPFAGADERISFAFDVVPDNIGRPHRLQKRPDRR